MRRALLLVCLLASSAIAQEYPAKPVRLVNAFPPGSALDVILRLVSAKLAEAWSQPAVVEHRIGAAGNVGARSVARSPADGYTILGTSNAIAVNVTLYKDAGFTAADLVPVARIGVAPTVVFVHPSLAAGSLPELVQLARREPVSYASAGTGTPTQLFMEWLKRRADADILHVPFTPAAAVNAVVGNQAPVGVTAVPAVIAQIRAGKLRPLAVGSAERAPQLPEVPTVAEAGYPGFVDIVWFGLFVPVGTAAAVIERIHADTTRALESTDTREKLAALSIDAPRMAQSEFDAFVRREVEKYRKVIQETGVRVD